MTAVPRQLNGCLENADLENADLANKDLKNTDVAQTQKQPLLASVMNLKSLTSSFLFEVCVFEVCGRGWIIPVVCVFETPELNVKNCLC